MKKIFSFFAISAIVLGMASCGGETNEPESKDFQINVMPPLSTRAQIAVIPSKKDTYYYASWFYQSEIDAKEGGLESIIKKQLERDFSVLVDQYAIRQNVNAYFVPKNLMPDTKIVICACYVENDMLTGKVSIAGDIVTKEFTTLPKNILNGEFTVDSKGKKVHFYSSNMQVLTLGLVEFSDNQYWFVSSSSTSGKHDLVPWTKMTNPVMLTADEWWYLFRLRPHAEERFAHATITIDGFDKHGLILLPDNWEKPYGVPFTTDYDMNLRWNETNQVYIMNDQADFNAYAQNKLNKAQWEDMEMAGAVFLPAAGYNNGAGIFGENSSGCYWSASVDSENDTKAFSFNFGANNVWLADLKKSKDKTNCFTIRPVCEFK